MRRTAIVGACLATLLGFSLAYADSFLDRAEQALKELRYEDAARLLDQAWKRGDNSHSDLIRLHASAARTAIILGRFDDAADHFDRMLSMDPSATLAPGTSPKVLGPFREAQLRARNRPPLSTIVDVVAAMQTQVHVKVVDAAGLAATVRLRYEREGLPVAVEAAVRDEVVLQLPTDHPRRSTLSLHDAYGNTLSQQSVLLPVRPASPGRQSVREIPWIWVGASAGLTVAGAVFGLQARSTQGQLDDLIAASSEHNFSRVQEVESRLRNQSVRANLLLGLAATSATVTIVRYLLSGESSPQDSL